MRTLKGLRWWIVGLICLGTIINYLARNSLAVLAPVLQHQLHFSTAEYSYIIAAFQIGYTVMQTVCGIALDYLGLRLGFALFGVAWSLFNVLHAFATGWITLALFRGLLGLAEAAAIPAGIKAISEWFPAKERSVAVGYFNAGTSLGALLAPPLVVWVSLQHGWQMGFVVTGGLGFVWVGMWYLFYRPPSQHAWLGRDERAYILAGQTPAMDGPKGPMVRTILKAPKFWGIAVPRMLAEPAWQTFNFWIPLYLANERHMNLKEIAIFAWLPFLAADLGGIFGGYLSPLLMKHFHFKLVASRLAGIVLGAILMIGPGSIGLAASPFLAIGLFCMGGFAHQMISALLNTLSADVFAPHEVATANGLTGTASWTGGLTFSLLVGALATTIGYGPLFACLTVFDLVGATVAVLLLRREEPRLAAPAAG